MRLTNRYGYGRLHSLIVEKNPSIIVSTFPLAVGAVAALKESGLVNIPDVTVITDHTDHIFVRDLQSRLHADETTLQVLREPGRSAESTSYLWIYRTGRGVLPAVLYDYQMTRGGTTKSLVLHESDAGHARRKYDEALKAFAGEEGAIGHGGGSRADVLRCALRH